MKKIVGFIIVFGFVLSIAALLIYKLIWEPVSNVFETEPVTMGNIAIVVGVYVALVCVAYSFVKLLNWAFDQLD